MVFVDKITIITVLRLLSLGPTARRCEQLYYFSTGTRGGLCLLKFLRWIGLLRAQLCQAEYFLGDLRTLIGSATWLKLYHQDLPKLYRQIQQTEFAPSCFLQDLGNRVFDFERLMVYFEKRVFQAILPICIQINVVEWLSREKVAAGAEMPLFLVVRSRWFSYLREYAAGQRVRLCAYPSLFRLPFQSRYPALLKQIAAGAKSIWPQLIRRLSRPRQHLGSAGKERSVTASAPRATLAVHYTGRTVSFDPQDRSDFFWLSDSGIAPSEVLLYLTRPDAPLTPDMAALLREKGIRAVAMNPEATQVASCPVWRPSLGFLKAGLRLGGRVVLALLRSWLRGDRVALANALELGPLLYGYAYGHDFFTSHRIKVNLDIMEFSPSVIGRQLALQDLGGISIAYQWSAIYYLPVNLMSCADVLFTFSETTQALWQAAGAPVKQFVPVGYIYDQSFEAVKPRARQRRSELSDSGAEFVIAFFDENSSKARNGVVSNEHATQDYEVLLTQLLADSTLGLVCKPKKPGTLFQRIGRIMPLVETARRTGRLLFLDQGNEVATAIFPAEAGLMADVVIGLLGGTTAALEAYLAGTPAVLIDTLELYDHPFYQWGRNKVVFDSWETLFAELQKYRADPTSVPGFGDWSPVIEQFDPFRDGMAGTRMGQYLCWLLDALQNGRPPQVALRMAATQYAREWGQDRTDGLSPTTASREVHSLSGNRT